MELNPGSPQKNGNFRQTLLQASDHSLSLYNNIDRTFTRNEVSEQEPSLSDVMRMLTGMKQDINERFDTLRGHLDMVKDSRVWTAQRSDPVDKGG